MRLHYQQAMIAVLGFCTCKAILGRGQLGLVRRISHERTVALQYQDGKR